MKMKCSSRKNWVLGLILGIAFSCQEKAENTKQETSQAKSGERALAPEEADGNYPYRRLSTYGFFEGEMNELEPASNLTLYRPASSLFTDYAWKSRFVYFPDGSQAEIIKDEMELPIGSILIKNFYYPNDFRKPEEGKRIIETRLMIHEEGGWQAYPYLWNEEQTDAVLKVVGAQLEVKFTDASGKDQIINYLVPNKNQCKSCHNKDEKLAPIGIQPKHLNHELDYGSFKSNQLAHWAEKGNLKGFEGAETHPSVIDYEDKTQALDDRAMAYLDINCSHCHRAEGPASTSGLFLTYDQKDPLKLGVNKTPVAAGKGAGSFRFDIQPGKADESILTYRMNSTEVGVAMPEIGRTTVHEEGVELIRQWINSMPESK